LKFDFVDIFVVSINMLVALVADFKDILGAAFKQGKL
jgi:hypothetical protein